MRLTKLAVLGLLFLSLVATSTASAQRGAARGRRAAAAQPREGEDVASEPSVAAPTLEDLDTIVARMRTGTPDQVREAIDLMSVIDDPAVVPPLAELLRAGQSDTITDRALEALRGLAHPSAIDVLVEFTHHRRAAARRRAYQALSAIQDRRVPTLVEHGLRDSDRTVRGACALALGNMGARGSLETLFRAFDRGVVEAAVAIGKLGDAASVTRFGEELGRQPLSVMLSGYDQYLRRTDIPEQTKIDIVTRLGEISGRTVREFLSQYLATFTERDRSRLRTVVQDTLRRIPIEGDTRRTVSATAGESGGAQ